MLKLFIDLKISFIFIFFSYGVAQFVGTFMMAKWKVNGTDFNTTVKVDSLEVPALLFHTPLDRSFTCSTWGSTKLKVNIVFPLKVSKSQKQFIMSKLFPKKWTKLTILSKEDGQDSKIGSFFGRSFDIINCFRDLLTFSSSRLDSRVEKS